MSGATAIRDVRLTIHTGTERFEVNGLMAEIITALCANASLLNSVPLESFTVHCGSSGQFEVKPTLRLPRIQRAS